MCRSVHIILRYNLTLMVALRPKLWRAFTTFFFFGNISIDFVFHLFFLWVSVRLVATHMLICLAAWDTVECSKSLLSMVEELIISGSYFSQRWCFLWVFIVVILGKSVFILTAGNFASSKHAFPFLTFGLRAYLHVVPPESDHPNISIRNCDHHSALPPARARCILVVLEWHLESCCGRFIGLRSRPRRMVHKGCLAERNDGKPGHLERCAWRAVSLLVHISRITC